MVNHTSCTKSSSSSSSSSSESCFKPCHKKCGSESCSIEECERYCPEELACKFSSAVVTVHAEFILLGTGAGTAYPNTATGGTPLGFSTRADIVLNGNGFFVGKGVIVTAARNVLLPPALTSSVVRFPYDTQTGVPGFGVIRNEMVRASRIFVGVQDVNRKGHGFTYEVDLLGVDGAGDIAVLRINCKKQWNRFNPRIRRCHPHFKWGKSRATKDGEPAYLFGDYISSISTQRRIDAAGAIIEGIVSDHRYVDYQGIVLPELLLVSAPVYSYSAGLPIINAQGEIIGMQTCDVSAINPLYRDDDPRTGIYLNQSQGCGLVAGPSEYFMRPVVRTLVKGTCTKKFNGQIENICDPVGAYYRYLKGYMGIAYDLVTAETYDYTADFTSAAVNDQNIVAGQPRIRLDASGAFSQCPNCKELIGLRILGLAGANPNDALSTANGYYYVPGGTGLAPLPASLPISPFLNKLPPGSIITHIEGVPIGDLEGQVAPSLVTWRTCAGDQIKVCYRLGGNALNTADNSTTENYNNLYEYLSCVEDFPRALDYPFCTNFPQILVADATTPVYPGFVAAADQIVNPQVIQRASASTATLARPAL